MKIGTWAGYPILAPGGEVLGCMCVIDENPHTWQPAELATLATMARAVSNEINLRTSLTTTRNALAAAENALETSSSLARSLQDSLLPPVLQKVPGLDAAASYLPAAGGTTVVGDFYDLLPRQGPVVVHGDGRRVRQGHRGGESHGPGAATRCAPKPRSTCPPRPSSST
ncbi:GAF domain-containing protein [Streptomyces sp. NPDC005283]|uniref:GAF domain-containing protein n=1 Tax=Streptomyces sp. NPDC005283 TaxID=3156871 RepID=UPI00345194C6